MGKTTKHNRVKLIGGFIFKEERLLNKVRGLLEAKFGDIDFESKALDFKYTDYYKKELGTDLKKVFVSFKRLIEPQSLPQIKILTNKIEKKFSIGLTRQINIDPGYLELSKLVLATTKDFKHRIFLDNGIYAEVTLYYGNKSFRPWEWTYPDYKSNEYIEIFNQIREIYYQQASEKLT